MTDSDTCRADLTLTQAMSHLTDHPGSYAGNATPLPTQRQRRSGDDDIETDDWVLTHTPADGWRLTNRCQIVNRDSGFCTFNAPFRRFPTADALLAEIPDCLRDTPWRWQTEPPAPLPMPPLLPPLDPNHLTPAQAAALVDLYEAVRVHHLVNHVATPAERAAELRAEADEIGTGPDSDYWVYGQLHREVEMLEALAAVERARRDDASAVAP